MTCALMTAKNIVGHFENLNHGTSIYRYKDIKEYQSLHFQIEPNYGGRKVSILVLSGWAGCEGVLR